MSESYYTMQSLQADNSVGFLIKRCGIVMTQLAERHFESQPISFTQWMALIWLSQRPHASPTELSAHMGHDLGALTRMIDELEHRGLVRRDRSEHDRRAVQIAVTPEGRRLANTGKRLVLGLMNELLMPYPKAEVGALIAMLQRLLSRLQDSVQRAAPATAAASAQPRNQAPLTRPRRSRTVSPGVQQKTLRRGS
jgi:DNA-binding MarR family transcriptional regulator